MRTIKEQIAYLDKVMKVDPELKGLELRSLEHGFKRWSKVWNQEVNDILARDYLSSEPEVLSEIRKELYDNPDIPSPGPHQYNLYVNTDMEIISNFIEQLGLNKKKSDPPKFDDDPKSITLHDNEYIQIGTSQYAKHPFMGVRFKEDTGNKTLSIDELANIKQYDLETKKLDNTDQDYSIRIFLEPRPSNEDSAQNEKKLTKVLESIECIGEREKSILAVMLSNGYFPRGLKHNLDIESKLLQYVVDQNIPALLTPKDGSFAYLNRPELS